MNCRLTKRAEKDFETILNFSVLNYGRDAATAMDYVGNHPDCAGSLPVASKPGLRSFSVALCCAMIPRNQRVANPPHKLIYGVATDGVVEILAIVGTGYPAGRASRKR